MTRIFIFCYFALCLAAHSKRSTIDQKHFAELGLNANHRHCEGAKDVRLLHSESALDHDQITPHITIAYNESTASLKFSAELFYLPRDAYYIVSVGTKCLSRRQPTDSASVDDDLAARASVWGHAPNALYRDALTDARQFGAYYVDTEHTGWSVRASGCSHVVYEAEFAVDQLVAGCGVDHTSLGTDGEVQAIASIVNVQLFEHDTTVRSTDWPAPFSLYIDERDSAVLAYQSPMAASQQPPAHVVLRSISIDPRNILGVTLQTQQPKETAKTLQFEEIAAHGASEPSFELDIEEHSDAPYIVDKKRVVQNWRLSSHTASELFDGDFALRFSSTAGEQVVQISFRIANGDTGAAFSRGDALHSEITQHLAATASEHLHEDVFSSGQRACMQTYVIGHESVTSKLRLRLLEAWLCVDTPDSTPATELACPEAKHRIQLVGAYGRPIAKRNVTIQSPGAYGPMSVAVCFNVDTLFRDDNHVTVLRKAQRYETRVQVGPSQFRTVAHEFVADKSPFEMLRTLLDVDELGMADSIKSQWMTVGPFSRYRLAAALEHANEQGDIYSAHAHTFGVAPKEAYLHNMDDTSAAGALVVIFVALVCFVVVVFAACLLPRRGVPERRVKRSGFV